MAPYETAALLVVGFFLLLFLTALSAGLFFLVRWLRR